MRALVTGGAGFIGTHLVEKLLKNNYKVIAVDNFVLGKTVPLETKEKINHNYEMIKKQVEGITGCQTVNNYDWIKDINVIMILKEVDVYVL